MKDVTKEQIRALILHDGWKNRCGKCDSDYGQVLVNPVIHVRCVDCGSEEIIDGQDILDGFRQALLAREEG